MYTRKYVEFKITAEHLKVKHNLDHCSFATHRGAALPRRGGEVPPSEHSDTTNKLLLEKATVTQLVKIAQR
jgi:hypothetical protein